MKYLAAFNWATTKHTCKWFKQLFPRPTKVGQVIGLQHDPTTVLNGVRMKVKSIGKEHFPEQ